MRHRRFVHATQAIVLASWVILVGGCATQERTDTQDLTKGDPTAPSQVTPDEALAIARSYTDHAWRPFAGNIRHAPDIAGVRIDTPDIGYTPPSGRNGWWVPGQVNEGIPYKWGGFDDPATFDRKIADGLAGGDVSTPAKRRADNAAVSAQSTGVDCSGFVSRCLKLPSVYDSTQLPAVCQPLPGMNALRPGDLLNIPREHVMLFAGWSEDREWIYYYETGGIPEWKAALKQSPLAAIVALGYQPLRYRGMARATGPTGKEVLTRAARAGAVAVPDPIVGDP
jgi:hypothetical protein